MFLTSFKVSDQEKLDRFDSEEQFWCEEEEEEGGTDEPEENEPEEGEEADTDDVFDDDEDDKPLQEAGIRALKKSRNELARLKKKLQVYKDIDLEEYKKIQEEKNKSEEQRLKDQEQYQTLSQRQAKSIKQKDEEIGKYQSQIKQLTKNSELKDYFYAAGGLQGISKVDGKSYYDHVNEAVNLRSRREKDGSYTVLDTDGLAQTNNQGKPMTLGELFDELKTDPHYGHFFKPDAKGGGGMTPGVSNGSGTSKKTFEDFKKRHGYRDQPKGSTIFK